MIGVITADIINSRRIEHTEEWINVLKETLGKLGNEGENWEIYRGDSFQLEILNPLNSFKSSIYIKACMKTIKNIDVRMAIGIGKKNYDSKKITSSNGEAFIYSGELFDYLYKTKQTLAVKTSDEQFNREINLYIKLAAIAMDSWSQKTAEFVKFRLEEENIPQKELGNIFNISQAAISQRNSRAYLSEILEINKLFELKLQPIIARKSWN